MSFLGEADETALEVVAANTSAWGQGVTWAAEGGTAGIPIVNAGPWGRDYHTPLERMHIGYGFQILPDLVEEIVTRVLRGGG